MSSAALSVVSSMLILVDVLSSTTGSTSATHVLKLFGLPNLVLECQRTEHIVLSCGNVGLGATCRHPHELKF